MKARPSGKGALIIGLTGGIGSGKSAAMSAFADLGVPCIDADHVARDIVAPGEPALDAIADHFGKTILTRPGESDPFELDRAQLRRIVFAKPEEREWLEKLLHPLISQRISSWLNKQPPPYCILSSPLLLETSQHELVDRVLLIDVPEALQIERTTARDNNPVAQVKAIIASQASRAFKQSKADDIILNDGSLAELKQRVKTQHDLYLKLAED